MLKNNQKFLGILQVFFSGICFGFLGYFGKTAYTYGITPGELLALRYSIAALLLGGYLFLFDRTFLKFSTKEKIISTLLGVCGYALFSSMFFYALQGISASLTVLLLYTYPVIVAIFSIFIFKEKMNLKIISSLFLVMIGLYLLLQAEWKVQKIHFIFWGLGAAFFYSLYILISRKYVAHLKATASSFYVQLGSGLALAFLNFQNFERPFEILSNHGLFIISMSFVCSLMAMTLFLAGLQKLTATETSILSTTEPVSGVILAILFLGEKMNASQIIGGILVLLGMIVINFKKLSK